MANNTKYLLVGDGGAVVSPGASADGYLNADPWFKNMAIPPEDSGLPANEPPPEPPPPGEPPNVTDKPPAGTNMDAWANALITKAWIAMFGSAPTSREVRMAQAISRLEALYGWPTPEKFPNWQGHHNWGASQCVTRVDGVLKSCYQNGGCLKGFLGKDQIDGKPYKICFEHNETNLDGAKRFLEVLLVKRPAVKAVFNTGDAYQVALAMRKTGYYARTKVADDEQMRADAVYYGGAIIGADKKIASNTSSKPLLRLDAPSDADPSYPADPGWPKEVSNLSGVEAPERGTGLLGALAGLALGIGLGITGRWAYKTWVSNETKAKTSVPPRSR